MPNNLIRGNKAHHCWLSSDLKVCELKTFVNVDPNILVARLYVSKILSTSIIAETWSVEYDPVKYLISFFRITQMH